ncbi:MAG: hypothetical protein WDM96_01245 [Lacunisphaera sp.]
MAEIGFVGKAPGKYQLWLGGDASGTRLNKVYKDVIKEAELEARAEAAPHPLARPARHRRTLRRLRHARPPAGGRRGKS